MAIEANVIDPTVALDLWNSGHSYGQIAERFPGTTRSAALWAVKRAVKQGLGEARRGRFVREAPVPPLVALWNSEGE